MMTKSFSSSPMLERNSSSALSLSEGDSVGGQARWMMMRRRRKRRQHASPSTHRKQVKHQNSSGRITSPGKGRRKAWMGRHAGSYNYCCFQVGWLCSQGTEKHTHTNYKSERCARKASEETGREEIGEKASQQAHIHTHIRLSRVSYYARQQQQPPPPPPLPPTITNSSRHCTSTSFTPPSPSQKREEIKALNTT